MWLAGAEWAAGRGHARARGHCRAGRKEVRLGEEEPAEGKAKHQAGRLADQELVPLPAVLPTPPMVVTASSWTLDLGPWAWQRRWS